MTALIIVTGIVLVLIPVSRIIQLSIQRSNKYSEKFKFRAKIIHYVVSIVCVVAGLVILFILNRMSDTLVAP